MIELLTSFEREYDKFMKNELAIQMIIGRKPELELGNYLKGEGYDF